MAEVRFEHVSKRYPSSSAYVIRDLNLRVRDGELLVLVGPSGCGKSTALRMVAGLEEITEGELYIGERLVNDVAPKDRDIAMVFQNYALYPHMSVYDNMAFSLKLRHLGKVEIRQRVERAADVLGIREYLARKPRALSGGQRQRVALGRALVRDPQVFLLDEPLSNLDAKLRVQTRTEIARLHQATQTTMIYVTHDQVEAMTMGDRIAVLNAGVIQQLGTPQELYDTPTNLFVAGFIGSPAMNFFAGRLIRQGDDTAVLQIGEGANAAALYLVGTPLGRLAGQASAAGRPVVVGVRPEDLRLAAGDGADTIRGLVEVVEHLGNEQLVYLHAPGAMSVAEKSTGGVGGTSGNPSANGAVPAGEVGASSVTAVTARVGAGERVRIGERVTLSVELGKLHLFDPATTNRFL